MPRAACTHELMPLLDPACLVAALETAVDGHVDPLSTTHAYARAARKLGAGVERFTDVEQLIQNADRSWRMITNKGEIHTEHVSTPVACGRGKWDGWSVGSTPCSPWNTCT